MLITKDEFKKACDEAYEKAGHNAYFGNGFSAGVTFVLNKLKENK